MAGTRADVALVARGLFESRAKAQEAIAAGLVTVDGIVVGKASGAIAPTARLEAARPYAWVSRGGLKLAAALDAFGIDPAGRTCLDVGASTGGFTHVLLARGAAYVVAVDVGHGQLHASLSADPRVRALEGTDARALDAAMLGTPPSLVVCDASFISLSLVLPPVLALAASGADLVALVKPQFEVGRGRVGRGGVVRDAALHHEACARVEAVVVAAGWRIGGLIPSPIEGGDGNVEFLLAARRPG